MTRAIDATLLLALRSSQIRSSDLPADMPLPTLQSPASYSHLIANWDGQWYRLIAEHGYPSHLPIVDGVVQQSAWAFYPIYPSLVRLVMASGASYGVAASVVSLLCGAGAMCLLYRLVAPRAGRFTAAVTVLAVGSAPAAFIFQAAYTESLALLLVLSGLWCLEQRRYPALVAVGVLLSLARPIVLPLALVTGLVWVVRWRRRAAAPFPCLRDGDWRVRRPPWQPRS